MNKNTSYVIIIVLLFIIVGGYFYYQNQIRTDNEEFSKKQECSQYNDLVRTKIEQSGRVFDNDSYSIKEIFYSPKLNTCLYAWKINTPLEPREIYSIDDVFGGDIFTVGISENAEELFYKEIGELKK